MVVSTARICRRPCRQLGRVGHRVASRRDDRHWNRELEREDLRHKREIEKLRLQHTREGDLAWRSERRAAYTKLLVALLDWESKAHAFGSSMR
jgi:hypothetical protein